MGSMTQSEVKQTEFDFVEQIEKKRGDLNHGDKTLIQCINIHTYNLGEELRNHFDHRYDRDITDGVVEGLINLNLILDRLWDDQLPTYILDRRFDNPCILFDPADYDNVLDADGNFFNKIKAGQSSNRFGYDYILENLSPFTDSIDEDRANGYLPFFDVERFESLDLLRSSLKVYNQFYHGPEHELFDFSDEEKN